MKTRDESSNSTYGRILGMLLEDRSRFWSGSQLSQRLGITRAAVWKHIESIRQDGVEVEAMTNRGYRVLSLPDQFRECFIQPMLQTKTLGRSMICFDRVDSTNSVARQLAQQGCPDGTVVIADTQTAGRGRRGRSWHTTPGFGLCMSVVLRPDVAPEDAPRYAIAAALGLRSAFVFLGMQALVKWPNDVLWGEKKLSGLLLEMGCSMEKLDDIVVGMGININDETFPEDIAQTAGSLRLCLGRPLERCVVAAAILNHMEGALERAGTAEGFARLLEDYRRCSATLGKQVLVTGVKETFEGVAEDVDGLGRLVLRLEDGSARAFASGDVTVRSVRA